MRSRGLFLLLFIAMTIVAGYQLFKASRTKETRNADRNFVQTESKISSEKKVNSSILNSTSSEKSRLPSTNENSTSRQIPKTSLVKATPLQKPSLEQLQALPSKSVGQRWQWWKNASVISKSEFLQNRDRALAEVSQKMVIEKDRPGSSPEEFFSDSPLVLFDSRKQNVGVLTGVYVVTAKTEQAFNEMLQSQDFEVINSFAHLRLLYLKPKRNPFSLNEVEKFLARDHRVQSVEYEILKGNLVKN